MASALASPPPLFSGGSSDLKANARKFLERALLISALVHLAAVGVFRAALERFAATEAEIPAPHKHWFPPTIFMPPLLPIPKHWTPPTGSSEKGVLVPRDKEVIFDTIDRGPGRTEFDPVRNPSPGGPDDPNPGPRIPYPPGPAPVFTYADTPPVPIVAPRPAYPT